MAGFLKFSDAASLALHASAFLAARPDRAVSTREIASGMNFSRAHLAKVLQRLTKAGLVKAVRGPSGGFKLARAPNRISLKQVYEAIEGRISLSDCLLGEAVCGGPCMLGDVVKDLDRNVERRLAKTKLSDVSPSFSPGKSG